MIILLVRKRKGSIASALLQLHIHDCRKAVDAGSREQLQRGRTPCRMRPTPGTLEGPDSMKHDAASGTSVSISESGPAVADGVAGGEGGGEGGSKGGGTAQVRGIRDERDTHGGAKEAVQAAASPQRCATENILPETLSGGLTEQVPTPNKSSGGTSLSDPDCGPFPTPAQAPGPSPPGMEESSAL